MCVSVADLRSSVFFFWYVYTLRKDTSETAHDINDFGNFYPEKRKAHCEKATLRSGSERGSTSKVFQPFPLFVFTLVRNFLSACRTTGRRRCGERSLFEAIVSPSWSSSRHLCFPSRAGSGTATPPLSDRTVCIYTPNNRSDLKLKKKIFIHRVGCRRKLFKTLRKVLQFLHLLFQIFESFQLIL